MLSLSLSQKSWARAREYIFKTSKNFRDTAQVTPTTQKSEIHRNYLLSSTRVTTHTTSRPCPLDPITWIRAPLPTGPFVYVYPPLSHIGTLDAVQCPPVDLSSEHTISSYISVEKYSTMDVFKLFFHYYFDRFFSR